MDKIHITFARFLFSALLYCSLPRQASAHFMQQGNKLSPSDAGTTPSFFGGSVALSADGNTAIVGALTGIGGAWIYTRSAGGWTQQGSKLVGLGAIGASLQGASVALS